MQARTQNMIGAFTSVVWMAAGLFFLVTSEETIWRALGVVILALGVLRAVPVVRSLAGRKAPEDEEKKE